MYYDIYTHTRANTQTGCSLGDAGNITKGPASREKQLLASSCLTVRLPVSACISAAPTGRISVKFGIGDFYGKHLRKPKFG